MAGKGDLAALPQPQTNEGTGLDPVSANSATVQKSCALIGSLLALSREILLKYDQF